MRPLITAIIAVATVTAITVAAPAREKLAPEAQLAKLLEGRVAGKARACISLSAVTSSRVIDKTAIIYRIGSTLWVNRPKNADSLDEDDVLVTKTTTSQLCSIDTVELHDRGTHMYNGFVSLGEFTPYRRAESN